MLNFRNEKFTIHSPLQLECWTYLITALTKETLEVVGYVYIYIEGVLGDHFKLIYRSQWSRILFTVIFTSISFALTVRTIITVIFLFTFLIPFFCAQPFLTSDDHEKVSRSIQKVKWILFLRTMKWLSGVTHRHTLNMSGNWMDYHWCNDDFFGIPKLKSLIIIFVFKLLNTIPF